MNDEQLNMSRSSRTDETAEDIFARIQRRRTLAMNGNNTERGAPHGAGPAHGLGHDQTGAADRGSSPRSAEGRATTGTTEHTGSSSNSAFSNFRSKTASGPRTRPPVDYPLLVDEDGTPIDEDAPDFRDNGRPRDSFPRSKTMQALLRYPTLTTAVGLAVAVPMATLVLRTPAARQTLLRIGKFAAEQEVWKYVRKLSK